MTQTPHTLLFRLSRQPQTHDWQRFVQLFTPLLWRWVRRTGVPERDAEDVLQELFLLCWKHLPTFSYDPGRSFHAWLWTVTRRFVRDWQRRTKREFTAEALAELAGPDEVTARDNEEFARLLVERSLAVVQSDFSPTTWGVFTAIAIHERPGPEVAKEFGLTLNAVYHAYSRVLHRLRTELAGFLE